MKKRILTFSFLFICQFSFAQFYFRPGYSIGLCNPNEINKVIYVHNQINAEYYATGKKLPEIRTFGDIAIAIGGESDYNTGWEIQWQNKHDIVKSEFEYQGQTIERHLKIRSNMLNLGFYGGNKHFALGGSFDFANFKGFYKRAPKDSIDEADYVIVFQTKPVMGGSTDEKEKNILLTSQMGLTLFGQYTYGILGARIFYQFQFMNKDIDNLDSRLLGGKIQTDNDLEDRLNNFGIILFLRLGGYRD